MTDTDQSTRGVVRLMRRLVSAAPGQAAEAALDHIASGGSLSRARLALGACEALAVPRPKAEAIAAGCELLHNASLVHDDVQDADRERRGRPAVWARHGGDVAICVGDLLISAAYAALARSGTGEAFTAAHHAVARAVAGQCADIDARGGSRITVQFYEAVAADKAGALFALPMELAMLAGGESAARQDAACAAVAFAIGYQMIDDIDDAAADARSGELNIVNVLAAEGSEAPEHAAARCAAAHLNRSAALAERLPHGSGRGLISLGDRLHAKLPITASPERVAV